MRYRTNARAEIEACHGAKLSFGGNQFKGHDVALSRRQRLGTIFTDQVFLLQCFQRSVERSSRRLGIAVAKIRRLGESLPTYCHLLFALGGLAARKTLAK